MEREVEIVKVENEPRRSIPSIAVTALLLAVALAAIIVVQNVAHEPETPQPTEQTQSR